MNNQTNPVSPGITKRTKVFKVLKWGVAGIGVLILLAAIFSNDDSSSTKSSRTEQAQVAAIKPAFDVPSLVSKNVDEIKQALGVPASDTEPTKDQLKTGIVEWDKSFTKNGVDLTVTYNPQSRQVVDFFIGTDDPSGITKDKERLLALGNLSETSQDYTIEFVKNIKDSTSYTGVKAIPKGGAKSQAQADKEQELARVEASVQKLIDVGVVKRIEVQYNEVYVNGYVWLVSEIQEKEAAAKVLAYYVGTKKGTNIFWVDILDSQSGKKLSEYSATFGFKNY